MMPPTLASPHNNGINAYDHADDDDEKDDEVDDSANLALNVK